MPTRKMSGRVDVCPFQRFGVFGAFGGSSLLSLKHYDARLGWLSSSLSYLRYPVSG